MPAPVLDVREAPSLAGELSLQLSLADGHSTSVVAATADELDSLSAELGLTRDDVRTKMREALARRTQGPLPTVLMMTPRASTPDLSRFASLYFFTECDATVTGCVWFDVKTNSLGPAHSPTAVRSHMRFLVNQAFAPSSASPRLIEAWLKWDAAHFETFDDWRGAPKD